MKGKIVNLSVCSPEDMLQIAIVVLEDSYVDKEKRCKNIVKHAKTQMMKRVTKSNDMWKIENTTLHKTNEKSQTRSAIYQRKTMNLQACD